MLTISPSSFKLSIITVTLGVLAACGLPMRAQQATESSAPKVGLVDDWTFHHLVFSNPGAKDDAVKNGMLEKWLKVSNDPRYQMQQIKRNLGARPVIAGPDHAAGTDAISGTTVHSPEGWDKLSTAGTAMKKDWSQSLGNGAATLTSSIGTLNSSSISGSSTLTVDGVTFDASTPATAKQTGTFTGNPTTGQTVTIGGAEVLTASLPTAASQTGTFASPPAASSVITVADGATGNTLQLTTNATTASYSLVFTGSAGNAKSITIRYSGGAATNTLIMKAVTTGSNACSSSTSGTFLTSTDPTTQASNFYAAISSCPSTIGVTSSVSSSTVTLTAVLPGAFLTVTNTLTNSTGTLSAGTNGSNACLGSNAGTFATSNSTKTLANNLITVINSCNKSYPAVGVKAAASGTTGGVTVTATMTVTTPWDPGNDIAVTSTDGSFTWGGPDLTGGSPGQTSGTNFAIDGVAADAAQNLAAAITTNGSAVGGIGITATSSGPEVIVTASAAGSTGNTITLMRTLTGFTWAKTTLTGGSDGTTSGTTIPPTFAYWSGADYVSSAELATNIATAVNSNTAVKAVITATANSPASGDLTFAANTLGTAGNGYSVAAAAFSAFTPATGTLSGGETARVQPNATPAMYGPSITTASCSDDFVVYPTGQAGAANIIAYNNLYAGGCTSGTVPSVYWAYNTGAGQSVTTSPIVSADGTQVAFIQSNGTTASLVVLKWAPGTGSSITSPVTLTNATAGSCTAATAPCMYSVAFANGSNDSISAPFYDFAKDDALYVGDDSGNLHKFTGVFEGTPVESTSPWPVVLGSNKVSSPVYDPNSGYVFVGDLGGTLYSVGSGNSGTTAGTPHGTAKIGDAIADAPLVDSYKGQVYAFVTTNSSDDNAIYNFGTGFTSSSSLEEVVTIGTGGAGYYLYAGTFDNIWFESANDTGNLYVVGNTGATTGATLYQVGISNGSLDGVVKAAVSGLTSLVAHPFPSPLTEFCNGTCSNVSSGATTDGTDYVFFSVNHGATTDSLGATTGCKAASGYGCVLSYNVSNPSAVAISGSGLIVTTPYTPGCWATGGIAIDNYASTAGASQIYFVDLNGAAAGGPSGATSSACATGTSPTIQAVQTSQSNP